MQTKPNIYPLRDETIISIIEKYTNFEYSIGDGDSIGGSFTTLDLERPIYIEPTEKNYFIQDLNDRRAEQLMDAAFIAKTMTTEEYMKAISALHAETTYDNLGELIDGLNELEKKYAK